MRPVVWHIFVAGLALGSAYWISTTTLMQSGVQFVTPVSVVLVCHMIFARGTAGWLTAALRQTVLTLAALFVALTAAHLGAPMPAQANGQDALASFGIVLFCVMMIALVGLVVVVAILLGLRLVRAVWRRIRTDDRSSDGGSAVLVLGLLGLMCLEGLDWAYRFDGRAEAAATVTIAAPPDMVWAAMQTATSPAVTLPGILQPFPQPVAVLLDEGTALGARREVLIRGREGEGVLRLQVTEASRTHARFTILENTSPMGAWIRFTALTYRAEPFGQGTELSVSLDYERLLAPAWVFDPVMRAASRFAMAVLAGDVAARAEARTRIALVAPPRTR